MSYNFYTDDLTEDERHIRRKQILNEIKYMSLGEIAKKHGISKQAVSKYVGPVSQYREKKVKSQRQKFFDLLNKAITPPSAEGEK